MNRLIKLKIINNMLTTKNHKFCSENLFKKKLKFLNKKTNKQSKFIIFLMVNSTLPTFELAVKTIKIKKLELKKYRPFLIKNKNRIFLSIKVFVKNNKILDYNDNFISQSVSIQQRILLFKNILTFYRW